MSLYFLWNYKLRSFSIVFLWWVSRNSYNDDHCRWRAWKIWAYARRLGPFFSVPQGLSFSGLIRRTTLISCPLRHARWCWGHILTWILTDSEIDIKHGLHSALNFSAKRSSIKFFDQFSSAIVNNSFTCWPLYCNVWLKYERKNIIRPRRNHKRQAVQILLIHAATNGTLSSRARRLCELSSPLATVLDRCDFGPLWKYFTEILLELFGTMIVH
jgi:hypothetical protein